MILAMGQSRGSAALLISVYANATDGQAWYARILSYRNQLRAEASLPAQVTIDGLCEVVRLWLEEIVDDAPVAMTSGADIDLDSSKHDRL
jgi:hypothetical protein